MKHKSLKICKYCHAHRNLKPKNMRENAMVSMINDWEGGGPWSPCYCNLEVDGFNDEQPLPNNCPYSAEHAVEVGCTKNTQETS